MELTINLHIKFIYLPLSYYKFPDSIKRSIDTNASKFIWKKKNTFKHHTSVLQILSYILAILIILK